MPLSVQPVTVTNTGQPQVVQIAAVSMPLTPMGLNIQLAANATVTIAPVMV